MPDTPSIVINKTMLYRGVAEEWSNRYHFNGATPANGAEWKALAAAIWASERTFLSNSVQYQGYLGYAAGNEVAVSIMGPDDLTAAEKTSGSIAAGATQPPGDVAAWVRWSTEKRNNKGRRVYARKYFHAIPVTGVDNISAAARAAMLAYGEKMKDGSLPGGFVIALPQGEAGGLVKVPTFVTTRTLKRRGKDPS